jgi:CheY-like chemotaxis protein
MICAIGEPRPTVLLFEDTREAREVYRMMLRAAGADFDVVDAADGEECLGLCRSRSFDCILLDDRLPDRDGLAVLAELGRGHGGEPLPVVMVTGQGNEQVAARSIQQGAQDYLIKNEVTGHALRRAVENAIEKVALRKRVARLEGDLDRLRELSERLGSP